MMDKVALIYNYFSRDGAHAVSTKIKKILLLTILIFFSGFLNAQDIIVLKKDESELKARIISVNDTLVTYRLWQSTDTTTYNLKRFEVLSFLYDESIHQSEGIQKSNIAVTPVINPGTTGAGASFTWRKKKASDQKDAGLLEKYHSGESLAGYVVTPKNDTLPGLISIKNVALSQLEVCFTGSDHKTIVYGLNEIIAYGYEGVRYEKVKTKFKKEIVNNRASKNGELFLNIEVDGPAKLYRFYTLKFRSNTYENNPDLPYYFGKMKHYFVLTNPKGKMLSTKGRTIKGCVNNLFYDNKELMLYVRDKGVNENTLPSTVTKYNEWYGNKK